MHDIGRPHTHEPLDHPGLFHERDVPLGRNYAARSFSVGVGGPVDSTLYVIDVSGGDKIPRKGGPGITQSDLLVVNKTDLAPLVGADLDVMARDARMMRGEGPVVFAQVTHNVGVKEIVDHVLG